MDVKTFLDSLSPEDVEKLSSFSEENPEEFEQLMTKVSEGTETLVKSAEAAYELGSQFASIADELHTRTTSREYLSDALIKQASLPFGDAELAFSLANLAGQIKEANSKS